MLKQAVYAVGRELTQSLGEVAGPKAKRDLAFEFNNRLANTDWPIWLTSKGSFGEKFKGLLDERAQMYRAALAELREQIVARLGRGFADGAQAQALAELPLPLRAIFNKWMLAAGGDTESDDDRVRLRFAGRRLAETVVLGCARVYGWRLTGSAIGGFNRAAAGAGWPMYIRGNGRLADELTGDLLSLSHTYGEALQALLGRVAALTGPSFVERGVVQVYDSLPWETREVATQALFEPLSWARLLRSARTADPRTAFLRSVPLFGWLPPDEAADLAVRVKPRLVKAGQTVIERDAYLDHALIVRRGALQAVVVDNGIRRVVEDVGPGGLVGVRSIIANEPSPYRYVAQAEAELWQVPATYVVERLHPVLEAQDAIDGERARLALLARIPLFSALGGVQRAKVARAMETVRLGPDEVVLQAGSESQGFFIVQAGELDVLVAAAGGGGADRKVSSLGPGEFFGEAALLNRTLISATVRSRTAVELLRLPPAHFYSLLGTATGAVSAALDQVQSRRAKERLRVAQAAPAGAEA
jgi:CRP-like cAMP-binding protein